MPAPLYVPTQAQIEAKAAELGVDLNRGGARARVARVIAEQVAAESAPPAEPAGQTEPEPILLSRTVTLTAIGQLVLDLHLIPNDPNEENREHDAAADRPAGHGGTADGAAGAGHVPGQPG